MSDLPPNNVTEALIDRFVHEKPERPVSPWLAFGIFLLPIIFSWFLLREGHSFRSRVIGFGWLVLATIWGMASN